MKFDGTEEQLEMIREIAESLTDPVFLVDKAYNVWYHNRAFEALVGIRMSSRRYKGAPCHKLLGLKICGDACVMRQAVQTRQDVRLAEIEGTTANGESHNFHITAVPVFNTQGAAFGALIFLRDITAETQIHRKYKELVARNTAISLYGRIEGGNVVDILQLLSFLQKTGRLQLDSEGLQGDILFQNGQMVGITLAPVIGEKALGRLLNWHDGGFSFQPETTVQITDHLTKSSDFMLMDALREKDEVGARKGEVPALDAKPAILRIIDREKEEVSEVVWNVYEWCLEGKNIEQIIEHLPYPDNRIYLALLQLKDQGIARW